MIRVLLKSRLLVSTCYALSTKPNLAGYLVLLLQTNLHADEFTSSVTPHWIIASVLAVMKDVPTAFVPPFQSSLVIVSGESAPAHHSGVLQR